VKVKGSRVTQELARLSILDLFPTGNQPMSSDCRKHAIVFSGDVYDHLELRKKWLLIA
jgi:asparagine synthase (glutamine-hydrolysing)